MFYRCFPAQLRDEEWESVRAVFAESSYLKTIDELRRCKNLPQMACYIFPKETQNHAHENVNALLRLQRLPFRLTRIGSWAWPLDRRPQRRLAIVRWPLAQQTRMQLVPPETRYGTS